MNLRHHYEQLIAEKLRKLPAPDAEASWQQMKRLLDDEDIRAGGGKRPPGNGGWWRVGIIAIALSASLWLYVEKTSAPGITIAKNNTTAPPTADDAPVEKTGNTIANVPGNHKTTTIDKNITLPVSKATAAVKNNDKSNDDITVTAAAGNTKNSAAVHNPLSSAAEGNNINAATEKLGADKAGSPGQRGSFFIKGSGSTLAGAATGSNKKNTNNTGHNSYGGQHPVASSNERGIINTTAGNRPITDHNKTEPAPGTNSHAGNINTVNGRYLPVNQTARPNATVWLAQLNDVKLPGVLPRAAVALPDSIDSNRNINTQLNNETRKGVAKAQRDKALEDMTRKEKKSFHLNLSNVFKPFSLRLDADPRWAAGIALNSAVTVNAQSRYNYNINGKSGTLSDYIPSVYLQFHLNDYVYAQTEINFISPQYTPQLLVYQQSGITTQAGISQQKSIYIQKLYYFNLPMSLHYSPINNLYFSAGLQFSSFQSGLVSIQEKQFTSLSGPDHPTGFNHSIVKFKDDSIAARLAPNEWRWQAGAEYYWNRFTIGLRYNRSFKDLLNVNLSGSLPPTALRNESLILSVRYNLFESRKKGEPGQKN